jgi:hypothetical protein
MKRISTKQKKELYSLSSLLIHLLIFIGLLISLGTDSKEQTRSKNKNAEIKEDRSTPFATLFASFKS